jgi:hypothetical protein
MRFGAIVDREEYAGVASHWPEYEKLQDHSHRFLQTAPPSAGTRIQVRETHVIDSHLRPAARHGSCVSDAV